jgi:hypothetical protein
MNTEQFAYWLQGFVELHGQQPTQEQWSAIKDHLKLVFEKKTPGYEPVPHLTPATGPRYELFQSPVFPLGEPRITCTNSNLQRMADCVSKRVGH